MKTTPPFWLFVIASYMTGLMSVRARRAVTVGAAGAVVAGAAFLHFAYEVPGVENLLTDTDPQRIMSSVRILASHLVLIVASYALFFAIGRGVALMRRRWNGPA
jgi:hypothetical protein